MFYKEEEKINQAADLFRLFQKQTENTKSLETIGSSFDEQDIELLVLQAKQEIERIKSQAGLFISESDLLVESIFQGLSNASVKTVGPEIVFGSIYDKIGFGVLREELFRHLIIARLAYPLSKLKTVDYLYRYQGIHFDIDAVYRFLDKLNNKLKSQVEQIAFAHTLKILHGKASIVFYDMTTLLL